MLVRCRYFFDRACCLANLDGIHIAAGAIELRIPEGCAAGTRITVTHGEAVHQPQAETAGPGRVFHLYDCGAHGNGCTAFVVYICSGLESAADGTNVRQDLSLPNVFSRRPAC